jgi:molybdenum cofactor guanylyltransferase
MGIPKATLEWHGSTLLRRVSGIVQRSVDGPVVVVCATGQAIPALSRGIEVVSDSRPGRGPLQGLAAGLDAVGDRVELAYVSSVDVPLLHPEFVRAVVDAARAEPAVDITAPVLDGRAQPLAAAYRVAVRGVVAELLAEDRLALRALLERCRVRRLDGTTLPSHRSTMNVNSPAEYATALAMRAPGVLVEDEVVSAWMLGDVLRGAGTVRLNGEPVEPDPELPLVAGDVISFSFS